MSLYKKFLTVLISCTAIILCVFSASAQSELASEIISVSYRGDTAFYPGNSLEGVISAFDKGADMVSVSVTATKDGVLVLGDEGALGTFCNAPFESIASASVEELSDYNLYDSNGKLTEYSIISLSDFLKQVKGRVIIDTPWENREAVYEAVSELDAFSRVYLRVRESAKEIAQWLGSKQTKLNVIGVYGGNIIFSTVSHFDILSKCQMPLIQYQSKNYFNVVYGELVYKRFLQSDSVGVIAPMYAPDLCGQRQDNSSGWSELIDKGFNVIETNNIEGLASYIENARAQKSELLALYERVKDTDTEGYTSLSSERFVKALSDAQLLINGNSSLDGLEKGYSQLVYALNNLNLETGKESQKGELEITAGKVIAAVLVGTLILAAQVYVHKMQSDKKGKKKG